MKCLVAFSSPKRSAKTLETASNYAKAQGAELFLLRVIPDPKRVGVVAELIASDRPMEKAQSQITEAIASLTASGLKASGEVRVGRVARTIISVVREIEANMVFVGTTGVSPSPFSLMPKDPIVHYLVDHCPVTLCLVRGDQSN